MALPELYAFSTVLNDRGRKAASNAVENCIREYSTGKLFRTSAGRVNF